MDTGLGGGAKGKRLLLCMYVLLTCLLLPVCPRRARQASFVLKDCSRPAGGTGYLGETLLRWGVSVAAPLADRPYGRLARLARSLSRFSVKDVMLTYEQLQPMM